MLGSDSPSILARGWAERFFAQQSKWGFFMFACGTD